MKRLKYSEYDDEKWFCVKDVKTGEVYDVRRLKQYSFKYTLKLLFNGPITLYDHTSLLKHRYLYEAQDYSIEMKRRLFSPIWTFKLDDKEFEIKFKNDHWLINGIRYEFYSSKKIRTYNTDFEFM